MSESGLKCFGSEYSVAGQEVQGVCNAFHSLSEAGQVGVVRKGQYLEALIQSREKSIFCCMEHGFFGQPAQGFLRGTP